MSTSKRANVRCPVRIETESWRHRIIPTASILKKGNNGLSYQIMNKMTEATPIG